MACIKIRKIIHGMHKTFDDENMRGKKRDPTTNATTPDLRRGNPERSHELARAAVLLTTTRIAELLGS